MEIRKAKLSDIEKGLLELFIDGYRYHQTGRPDKFMNRSDDNLKEILNSTLDTEKFIIVELDKKVIGYASYQIKEKNQKKFLWIDELIIDENYRKNGYAKELINELESISKKEGCSSLEFCCWEFNKNAQEIYEHLGYKVQRKIYEKEV